MSYCFTYTVLQYWLHNTKASTINKITSKTKSCQKQRAIYKTKDVRPMKGSLAVSALATTLGAPRQTMAMASKNEECGAITTTGASLGLAGRWWRPIIFTRWNPAATTTSLMRERMEKRSLLEIYFMLTFIVRQIGDRQNQRKFINKCASKSNYVIHWIEQEQNVWLELFIFSHSKSITNNFFTYNNKI